MSESPDFETIHKRAADIITNEPMLAYAIANAIRKSIVGKKIEDYRYIAISNILRATWNLYCEKLQHKTKNAKWVEDVMNLIADMTVTFVDVLKEDNMLEKKK